MSNTAISLAPIVSYPKVAYQGEFFDLKITINTDDDWPYDEDSCVIGLMVSGPGVMAYATGPTHVRLHRDGTCTTARFEIEPRATGDQEIYVSFISQGGLPFRTVQVPVQVLPQRLRVQFNGKFVSECNQAPDTTIFALDGLPYTLQAGRTYEVSATLRDPEAPLPYWEESELPGVESITPWVRASASADVTIEDGVARIIVERLGTITPATIRLTAPAEPGEVTLRFELLRDTEGFPTIAEYRRTVQVVAADEAS